MSRWLSLFLLLASGPLAAALDPTRPDAAPPAATAASDAVQVLRLQGILRGPAGSSAIIDGHRLRAGEQAGDLRVLEIRARSVLVERQGSRQVLTLTPPMLSPRR